MRYFIIFVFLTYNFFLGAQGFNKSYVIPHSNGSYCKDVIEAPNGNIILTGIIGDTIANAYKIGVLGVDALGNQLWFKSYGKSTFQYLDNSFHSRYLIQDSLHFYIYSAALDSNNKYFSVLIKFDYNGDTIWQKKFYDPTDYLYVQGITKSVDNGFLMTGFFEGSLRTTLLIKTDNNGNELWRKKIAKGGSPNTQAGHKIIQDSVTGKIVIAGYQYNWNPTEPGNFVMHANIIVTNSIGTVLTKTVFTEPCGGYFKDLIQTKDKFCVAAGGIGQCVTDPQLSSNNEKGYAIKFDLNNLNNIVWQKQFDTTSYYNGIQTIDELKNGDLILNGYLNPLTVSATSKYERTRLIKLDKNGNLKWKLLLNEDTIDSNRKNCYSLNKMMSGGFLLANQLPYFQGAKPYNFTKIDSTGCDSTLAYCTYIISVGLNKWKMENGKWQVYPNPVNNELYIESGFEQIENAELRLIDVNGREIKKELLTPENKITILSLTPGVYFLQIRQNNEIVYKTKIVKE